ncbi:MAG: hypothetical protein AB1629_08375 [Candidatus Omnitrophota bacterium]
MLNGVKVPHAKEQQDEPIEGEYKVEQGQEEQQIYSLMQRRDEEQMVAELEGRYIEEFVYEFCRRHTWLDGKRPPECKCLDTVVGLSYIGAKEASRKAGIQVPIEKMQLTEMDTHYRVVLQAKDSEGNSRIGIAQQSKKMKLKSGAFIDDEFALNKCLGKAQRNALAPLIPQTVIKQWINKHRLEKLEDKEVLQRIKEGYKQLKISTEEQARLEKQYPNNRDLLNHLLNLASQKATLKPEDKKKPAEKPNKDEQIPVAEKPEDMLMLIKDEYIAYLKSFNPNADKIEDLDELSQQVVNTRIKQLSSAYKENLITVEDMKQELWSMVVQKRQG